MRKLKQYKVTFDSEVFAISLVKEAAIDMDFVYLSKEKESFVCLEKEDKHLVVGVVLRPDYPIYRNQGGEEFYLTFGKDVIEKLAYSYLQNDHIYSFTEQHEKIADGISIVESWLKTSENDKSNDYGIDAPIGSWLIAAKVENEDIWQGIKNGEMKGFSVESFVNLEEIKLNKTIENNMFDLDDNFWDKIKAIITDALKSPSTPQTEAVETAEAVVADMIEETSVTEEVVEEPQVEEATEEVVEPTEEVAEEPIAEEVAEEVTEEVVEEAPTVEEAKEDLQAIIDELNQKIDELNTELEALQKENVKLSKQPSTKPLNTHMSSNSSENPMDRVRNFYSSLRK